ncbi:Hypothetical_protein [Hexamita inflata]|uniref:Hypothetical_protein n=1 Tax=Hexamita inflata TaxID=28002 RepID=A0AA86RQS7_9EUKA|nr:Hypothetical protein HINF_LOCUS63969 [Hexamita inflata]
MIVQLIKILSFVQSGQLYAQYSGLYLIFSALICCVVLFFLLFSPSDDAEQHDEQTEQEPEPNNDSGHRQQAVCSTVSRPFCPICTSVSRMQLRIALSRSFFSSLR